MSLPLGTAVHLARSRTPADRSRIRLTVAAFAFSGALLIGAGRVLQFSGELDYSKYSNYLAESGLRPGLVTILVLLAVLSGSLAVQALRIGTAARERRLVALRLAGASEGQVRRLATIDAALAGLAGALWAGPVYLVLTFAMSGLPRMMRLLPGATVRDVLAWVGVIAVLTLGAAGLGHFLHRGTPEVQPVPAQRMTNWGAAAVGAVLVLIGTVATTRIGLSALSFTALGVAFFGAAIVRRILVLVARWMRRSPDPVDLLTASRLVADLRPASRLGILLFCCGFLVGSITITAVFIVDDRGIQRGGGTEFYLTGFGLAAFGLVLIGVIALAALTVGVADQLVDQRRQLACLTALGVGTGFLGQVVRRQLVVVAAPSTGIGLFVGAFSGTFPLIGFHTDRPDFAIVTITAIVLLFLGLAFGVLGAAVAGHLLRNQLRDALDPENLRAA
ncbi:hypothetical protein FB561_1189 [Kribbella amoyensis]|uniref:FtsX-like permease family protein n=1 Tax=Kribbella amoyensis TaxID=996641 RepID=A0A561BMQ4_9ACTN|nr:hypothetical protein [Kribbella amoyensis]TWD80117.1 hypothetical protein FB561_1189 [Kribbella amoyensis]